LVAITAAYQTDWSEVAVPSGERPINRDSPCGDRSWVAATFFSLNVDVTK
jgi:hypothetical protein